MPAYSANQEPRLRYLLTPPGDTRPSLLVELCPRVDEGVLSDVRQVMYGLGCASALVLDSERCFILRDTYASTGPDAIVVEKAEIETQRLLGAGGGSLEGRLERWHNALTTNWNAAIPREAWTAPLLTDVVPAASGSLVHRAMAGASR
jgi:hypothetical protein